MNLTAFVTCCFVLLPIANVHLANVTITSVEQHRATARLITTLTGSGYYNKSVIPAVLTCNSSEASCPIIVQARLFLIRIHDLVENQEQLLSTVRVQLGWVDPALRWDPEEYQGITSISIPEETLWVPNLQFANSVDDMYTMLDGKDFAFRVSNDGQVWWHPTGKLTTRCGLVLTYYPFDYQRCSIVIESVLHTASELLVIIRSDKPDPVSLGMLTQNNRWKIVDSDGFSVFYKPSPWTSFSRVHFWLVIQRDSAYYQQSFLIPVALLSVIQLMTYLMPMHLVDRVPQATVVLLTAFFLEGAIADRLPRSAEQSPVQTYLNILIAVSVLTIAVCAVTMEMLEPDEGLEYWGVLYVLKRISAPKKKHSIHTAVRSISGVGTDFGNAKRRKPPTRTTIAAAIINFLGFTVCALVIAVYPCVVFVAYISETPPSIPRPAPDNVSLSYYAEV